MTHQQTNNDSLIRGILSVSSASALIKIIGLTLEFITSIILARALGVDQYGLYIYSLTIITAAATLSAFGYDTAALRFIPEYKIAKKYFSLNGFIVTALISALVVSILLASVVSIAGVYLHTKGNPLSPVLLVTVPMLPLLTISRIRQHVLRALKYVIRSEILDIIIKPALLGITILCLTFVKEEYTTACEVITIQTTITVVTTVIGMYWLYRRIPNKKKLTPLIYNKSKWRAVALPLLFFSVMQLTTGYADSIMLGMLSSYSNAGIYSIAVRFSSLVSFSLLAINMILAPTISELYYSNNIDKLQQVIKSTTVVASLFAASTCILLILGGKSILTLYGHDYITAYLPLIILVPGHFFNVCCGSVGIILSMTGHHRYTAKVMAFTALINIISNYFLIPAYGMAGAAIATTVSTITWNIIMARYVRKKLNLQPAIYQTTK